MIVFVRRILLEDKRWLRSEDENCRFESELTRDNVGPRGQSWNSGDPPGLRRRNGLHGLGWS